jgi:hypothetical protein
MSIYVLQRLRKMIPMGTFGSFFWELMVLKRSSAKFWQHTNADQLQLSNWIDGAVQCVCILEQHPDWGDELRWITVRSLREQGSNISWKTDHINLKSWKGDTRVSNLVL